MFCRSNLSANPARGDFACVKFQRKSSRLNFAVKFNEALAHKFRFVLAIQISAKSHYAQNQNFIKPAFEPKFYKILKLAQTEFQRT